MAKHQKTPRPSKLDVFVASIVQDHAHLATADISRLRSLANFELGIIAGELGELAFKVEGLRRKQKTLEATLLGLGQVVEKRR